MVIGVAGPSCGGKNMVCDYLEKSMNYTNIDLDKLGHEVLYKHKDILVNRWGADILSNGDIDRKKIGKIVFTDSKELKFLEKISHSWIFSNVEKRIKNSNKNFLLNGAVLLESPLIQLCDHIFWITASRRIRLKRALKRDNLSKKEIIRRFNNQKPLKSQLFFKDVDIYSIDNSRQPEYCYKQVNLALSSF